MAEKQKTDCGFSFLVHESDETRSHGPPGSVEAQKLEAELTTDIQTLKHDSKMNAEEVDSDREIISDIDDDENTNEMDTKVKVQVKNGYTFDKYNSRVDLDWTPGMEARYNKELKKRQSGWDDEQDQPVLGTVCIIHAKNDGLECANKLIPLTEERYEMIAKTATVYIQFLHSKYQTRCQHFFKNYANLEPPYIGYGYHQNCKSSFVNKSKIAHEAQREERIAKQLANPREVREPSKKLPPKKKPRKLLQNNIHEGKPARKACARWSQTPQTFSDRVALHRRETGEIFSKTEELLQTIPQGFDFGDDPPLLDIHKGSCMVCGVGYNPKRILPGWQHLVANAQTPYGGKMLLMAVLKDDVVMKTRINRCIQRKYPVSYHAQCMRVYTNALDFPDQKIVDDLQELLSCLYPDPSAIGVRERFLTAKRQTPYDRVNFDDIIPESDHGPQDVKADVPDTNTHDSDENNDNFDEHDSFDDIPDTTHNQSVTESQSYKEFTDIVQKRIYDKSKVVKFTVLYDIYKGLSEKSGDMDIMNEDALRRALVKSFPTIQFHKLSILSSELVFKAE